MWWGKFLNKDDEARIVDAITSAEQDNRGEVRVHIDRKCKGDVMDRARDVFGTLGMHETRDDTGVLLYIAIKNHQAAVWAGSGIHGATESGFWQSVTDAVADGYRGGEGVAGITRALGLIGDMLREHAPGEDDAGDELPNKVTTA